MVAVLLLGSPDAPCLPAHAEMLGDFESDGWEGYACSFVDWTACINTTSASCSDPKSPCTRYGALSSAAMECLRFSETPHHVCLLFSAATFTARTPGTHA